MWVPELVRLFERLGDITGRVADDVLGANLREAGALEKQEPPDAEDLARIDQIIAGLTRSSQYQVWMESSAILWSRHYMRTVLMTVDSINTTLNLGVNLPRPHGAAVVAQGGTRMGLLDIPRDTRQALFRALGDGREAGEGPAALAQRIREYVPAGRFPRPGPSTAR